MATEGKKKLPSPSIPYPIPNEMFAEQRQRLAKNLKEGTCALIQGASEVSINYSDIHYIFRQDSYFYYLFGLEIPDCYGAVFPDGSGIVFIPRLPSSYETWMGPLPMPSKVIEETGVEASAYVEEIAEQLAKRNVKTVHVLKGVNSDSGISVLTAHFEGEDKFKVDDSSFLYETLSNQRVYKTKMEIGLLKYINKVSSNAHVEVMTKCKPGMSQHQLESTFLHHTYYHGGCRLVSYTCICATGHWGAVLHYPHNNQPIEDGTMGLLDMGGEYHCYGSDITCSYPVNGKFSPEQRWVYQAVLDAQRAVYAQLRPGASWVDMHKLALRTMSQALINQGLLKGTVEEIEKAEIMFRFQPHGMGHLLGMETHDVGGFPEGGNPRPANDLCKRLRTARIMEAGMFVTVEPGMYFNRPLLTEAFNDPNLVKFFNVEEFKKSKYWDFGGVRIEDDILIVDGGCINLTCCPREIDDIEAVMAGKVQWDSKPTAYGDAKIEQIQ